VSRVFAAHRALVGAEGVLNTVYPIYLALGYGRLPPRKGGFYVRRFYESRDAVQSTLPYRPGEGESLRTCR